MVKGGRRRRRRHLCSCQVTQVASVRRCRQTARTETTLVAYQAVSEEVAEEVVAHASGLGEDFVGSRAKQSLCVSDAAPAVEYICIQQIQIQHSSRYARRQINSWQHVQRQTISGDVWQMFSRTSSRTRTHSLKHLKRRKRQP